jgi:sterol desaturase/sphingolipid hydroxylase (fatty acid hydroxylase superfamily)
MEEIMDTLDRVLRAEIEPLQYLAFFGALMVFAIAETALKRSERPPMRGRRWLVNYGLTVLNILVLGVLPVSGVVAADFARANGIGLLNAVPVAAIVAVFAGVIVRSFLSWAVHLGMHKIPVLWRVHRVHHTDTFLDVSTTVRFHPFEFLINTPVLVGAVMAVGIPPVALMLYELFDAAMAVFTHANIRLPRVVERLLRPVLVTPDMHRVHHSSDHRETDSNYGATLSVWDHLFGTYRTKPEDELARMELGLTETQDDRTQSALWLLRLPFLPSRLVRLSAPGCVDSEVGEGSGERT